MSHNKLIQRLKQQPRHGAFGLSAQFLADLTVKADKVTDGFKSLDGESGRVLTGLEKIAGANQKLVEVFTNLNKEALKFIDYNKDLNKSFSINTTAAAKLSQELHKVAAELGISGVNMMKYAGSIKSIIPSLNQVTTIQKGAGDAQRNYYKGLVAVQKVLTTNLGLTEQQAEEYTYFATQTGENAANTLRASEAVAKSLDPEGDMGYFRIITEGIAKAGADAQMSFGKMPGNLEVAVLKANRLGLEISDLQSTAQQLLQIESSIGQELEYQLLSGHRLVDAQGESLTNQYRSAYLQGNASKMASSLNTILQNEGKVLENNVIARKQMADLLGIEESKLARALQKKKLLEESGAEILMELEGSELEAAARNMIDTGQLTESAFKELMTLSDNRTTEDIMKEQLQAQQDIALNSYLQTRQLDLIAKANGAIEDESKSYNKNLLQYQEAREMALGAALLTYRTPSATTVKTNIDNSTFTQEQDNELKDGLIINDGFVKFNPRDKFMQVADGAMIAGTNVDGNKKMAAALNGAGSQMTDGQITQLIQAFTAVGALIKGSIDSQTTQLKRDGLFAPGLNGSTF